jgi:hypothetical protein
MLARPVTPSDALDAFDSQVLTNSPAAGYGANPALARRVHGFTNGAAWIVPANDGDICLIAENAQALAMNSEPGPWQHHTRVPGANGASNCTSASAVTTGWLAEYGYTRETPGMAFTAGLVPDDVTQVTVTSASGTATLPIHENVNMGEVPDAPLLTSAGGRTMPIPGRLTATFDGPNGPVTIGG